ncbi:hypothetical protein SERLADRAFT_411938 [Serpula lacrymans var. lacrymans S7.9]|uniref:HTH psq-type domain-containing protein n=1 Tax=Serpula lacrymans var. lacrymans (strain S7.9) TaxID=578457 RepID=F8PCU2_SERL9|nr:uncharacterized protein SERLADRAFT_411938 [Serpula lacrymans var. lacrymans S7.9]EGO19041.1 hypothetical protein SERLADRAFT_411938 [Serpula lacrymans var. lacrymans S7.9]
MARQRKSAAKCPYRASKDLEYENRIQAAIEGYKRGLYKSYAEAARLNNVARQTLHNRAKGVHKTYQQGQEKKQLLSAAEESVLLDWTQHYGTMANPMCPKKLWSCKLDPKRAKNFNWTVVADYFAQQKQLNDMYGGIPPEHDWNMDEKGIQMGGGRKGDGTKYFYNRKQKESYHISDDNLELVTVIECISAAGVLMKPGFALKEGPLPDLSDVEGIGSISRTKTGWTNRGIFGRSWSSHTSHLAIEGIKINCYNIVPEYLSIRHIITPELIRTAFKETGIYPFNLNVFTEGDFVPSQVTSTSAHFPDSYPSDVDTSDESFHTSDGSNKSDTESDMMRDDSPPGLLGLTALPGPTVELDGYHDQEPSQEYRENNDEQEDESSCSSPFYPIFLHLFASLPTQAFSPTREGSTLPPELFSWPCFSNTPPPSPLQMTLPPLPPADPFLGLDVFPSPTPSDRVGTKATSAQRRCSGYMTRSSSAQSVGAVLNNGQNVSPEQDQRCSHPELLMQLQSTRLKVGLLEDENTQLKVTLAQLKAERDAANAHRTLARCDAEDIRKRSGNHRKPRRGTTEPTAQFLTHPELKAVFEQQEIERKEKARIDTEKEAKTVMKVFDRFFASYKRKEDLIVIAGALRLPIDGTVKALIERIKSHLQGHKELANNPRFAGLFGRRVQAPEGSSHSGQSSQSPLYSSVNSSTAFSPQSVQTPSFLATQSQFPGPTFYNGFSGPGCSTPGPSYNFNISEHVLPPPTDENVGLRHFLRLSSAELVLQSGICDLSVTFCYLCDVRIVPQIRTDWERQYGRNRKALPLLQHFSNNFRTQQCLGWAIAVFATRALLSSDPFHSSGTTSDNDKAILFIVKHSELNIKVNIRFILKVLELGTVRQSITYAVIRQNVYRPVSTLCFHSIIRTFLLTFSFSIVASNHHVYQEDQEEPQINIILCQDDTIPRWYGQYFSSLTGQDQAGAH